MSKTKYTNRMYRYLAWRLFQEMYGAIEWTEKESQRIDKLAQEAQDELSSEQIKTVNNRALRMNNEYEEHVLHRLRKIYWKELEEDEDDYFPFPEIDYNEEFYEIWKSAVMKRQTVKLKYDSTTSGLTERLVDSYKSSAPYGEGYCHTRQEVRKFRFDWVIDIRMTNQKFKKPQVW